MRFNRFQKRPVWFPESDHQPLRYIVLATASAFICLSLIVLVCRYFLPGIGAPVLAASMGAAAVLMFAAPTSPMARNWSFVAGNLVSALIGVTVFQWAGDAFWAGALAVAASIFVMHFLRCQHPPGGATALVAVIGGAQVHQLGYLYVLAPIGINVLIFELFVLANRRLLQHKEASANTMLE
ncbi:MAG: hypothetical protein BMS9Abin18_0251 [Zetaproteobacteria bacterium]|nr:MAG: hypothetical protein BMS9Abin18_0251 [Zetaproteobacteria bacterium]